jgi:hypothetical protein
LPVERRCAQWKGSLYFLLYGFGQEFHRKKAGIHSGIDDYVEWFEDDLHLYYKSVYMEISK